MSLSVRYVHRPLARLHEGSRLQRNLQSLITHGGILDGMALALRYIGTTHQRQAGVRSSGAGSHPKLDQEFVVTAAGLVLGRSQDADVSFFAVGSVAKAHVRVTLSEDGAAIIAEDLKTTNGTQKNGVTARAHRCELGDILSLAGMFDFVVVDQARPPGT